MNAQSSTLEAVKKRLYHVSSPIATKIYVTTRIRSRTQAANETLQEYKQGFTDFVIQTTTMDPTAVTCQVTILLFSRHLFNKEIEKQVTGTKTIQNQRHDMNPD